MGVILVGDKYFIRKEIQVNLTEYFAQKVQNQAVNIDLGVFSCYNGH